MKTKLNFGCGSDVIYHGVDWMNVDLLKMKGIDKNFDFDKFPYPLKTNQFDYVLIKQVLEHLLYPKRVLEELRRVCKDKATIEIQCPYANSRSAFVALDHMHYFTRHTFSSLDKEKFEIIEQIVTPQRFLEWLPKPMLNLLSVFFNSIYVQIDIKIKVIK